MDRQRYNVVSLSGGKDSTAMTLMMVEKKIPIDMILFCDTGLEFPAIYENINKVEKYTGIPVTRARAEHSFEYYFLETPVERPCSSKFTQLYGANHTGYGWAGPKMRWCTSVLKDTPRDRLLRPLRKKYDVYEYVGLAADETYRLERKRNQNIYHIHPLIDWGITEKEALQYCYDKGFDFGGLYKLFSRASCWCCPLQSLAELRVLREHFPDLWKKLLEWDSKTWRNYRADFSVKQLDIRFNLENERLANKLPIKGRAFFDELKKRLETSPNEDRNS